MLNSSTKRYSVTTDVGPLEGEFLISFDPLPDPDTYSLDEIEALVHRGVVRELLSEERYDSGV